MASLCGQPSHLLLLLLLLLSQVSSGATDDLRQATNMARHMVMQCGLNDELGPLYIEDEKHLSESLKQQVDAGAWCGGVVFR
jgi:ATP-dependent Zn protease